MLDAFYKRRIPFGKERRLRDLLMEVVYGKRLRRGLKTRYGEYNRDNLGGRRRKCMLQIGNHWRAFEVHAEPSAI